MDSIKTTEWRITLLFCAALCCGCNKSGPPPLETLAITGNVTMDGKPLSGADVIFTTAEGASFGGRTKEDGSYQLQGVTNENRSCKGECKVVINRYLKPDGSPVDPDEPPAVSFAMESLPARYSMPDKSELKAQVSEGGGTFNFDLQSK